ncbi:hypothetical protein B9479_005347 [Cryptococcus floricola]|uniref:Uncharacterized protein n=1 Tax=Cryptococcus floricola TaxID=2591691 RepID=A0A5D3AV26_9TREE|nr:hypothetical protein B9479_005347 [Cryptococcus floricola]
MVAAQASIRSHVQGIIKEFLVRSYVYRKTVLFPRDLVKMLEWVFKNCGDKYDEALQFAVMNTL